MFLSQQFNKPVEYWYFKMNMFQIITILDMLKGYQRRQADRSRLNMPPLRGKTKRPPLN